MLTVPNPGTTATFPDTLLSALSGLASSTTWILNSASSLSPTSFQSFTSNVFATTVLVAYCTPLCKPAFWFISANALPKSICVFVLLITSLLLLSTLAVTPVIPALLMLSLASCTVCTLATLLLETAVLTGIPHIVPTCPLSCNTVLLVVLLVGAFVITSLLLLALALMSAGLLPLALIFDTSVVRFIFCAWLTLIIAGVYVPAVICKSLFAVPLPITRFVLTLPCALYTIIMLPLFVYAERFVSLVPLIMLATSDLLNAVPAGKLLVTNGIVAPLITKFSPVLSAITGLLVLDSGHVKNGLPLCAAVVSIT